MALLNGNHDTACSLLLAGKPILFIPLTLEHWMFSVAVQRLGAGLIVSPDRPGEFAPKFAAMLGSDMYAKAAQRFSLRYGQNDPTALKDRLAERIEEILDPSWPQNRRAMPSPLSANGAPLPLATVSAPVETATPTVVSLVRNPLANSDAPARAKSADHEALDAGLVHHQHGRVNQAAELYQSVLARNPNDADALHLLGVLNLQTGRASQAVDLIGRAAKSVPGEASFQCNLGEAHRILGQYDRAIECCLTALRLRPDYPEACNNLALALQSQGKYKAAAARFQDAIRFNPTYAVAYNNFGALLGELGQFDDARNCFARARKLMQPE